MECCVESHDLVSDTDVYYQMWCYSYGTVNMHGLPADWSVLDLSLSDGSALDWT